MADYTAFLKRIGYVLPGARQFCGRDNNVDAEIATIAWSCN